ncbi:MAG: glycosyltransferase family 2 protein [Parvibaculum sp.]|nr:glycosyltransferase family 2 protein [Parvibaculum sp.]
MHNSVSVIMTCHNEAEFIEQAIRSVVGQSAFDFVREIIVVNDGSRDASSSVLERLCDEIPKLKVIVTDGIGVSAARNLAIEQSQGGYIAFLDGDDFWTSDKLERQVKILADSSKVGLVYSDFYDFTQDDLSDAQVISVRSYSADEDKVLEKYFVHDGPIIPSSAMIPRVVFDDVGLLDTELRVGEDTDLCLRIAERWRFQHVPGAFSYKRRHGRNLTHRFDALLPVAIELTRRFVARNPSLVTLAKKRMARRYASVGNNCIAFGERKRALSFIWKAFKNDPLYLKTYVYLGFAILPSWLSVSLQKYARRFYHEALGRRVA